MREIKFRAWDKYKRKIWSPHKEYSKYLISADGNQLSIFDFFDNSDFVLMQYVGIKDKKGKEIYEGDLLKISCNGKDNPNFLFQVIYDDINCRYIKRPNAITKLAKRDSKIHPEADLPLRESFVRKIEFVVGNIYENPELLNQS